jgi:hypothetical protein
VDPVSFTPTPFATPVFAQTLSAYRSAPYISPSEYRNAPTAVGTGNLVPGSNTQQADSTASLADVISRASGWMDEHCFHGLGGSFAAGVVTEQAWYTVKPNGSVVIIPNLRPIRAVTGLAIGPSPSQLQNLSPNIVPNISIGFKTITLPNCWNRGLTFPVYFGGYPSYGNELLCAFSYVNGWPHFTLGASASAGDTSIVANGAFPGDTQLYGILPGTPLTIRDGSNTERIVVQSLSGLTVNLQGTLQYEHTPPASPDPDSIMVSALPWNVEQACISMTSVFIKTQGMRAQVPSSLGAAKPAQKQALGRAGALHDFEHACGLINKYVVVYIDH